MATIGSIYETRQSLTEEKEQSDVQCHYSGPTMPTYPQLASSAACERPEATPTRAVFLTPSRCGGQPIAVEYEPDDAVWDYYGDPIPQGMVETGSTQRRATVFLAPPKWGGRRIAVEYEPDNIVWDYYGDSIHPK